MRIPLRRRTCCAVDRPATEQIDSRTWCAVLAGIVVSAAAQWPETRAQGDAIICLSDIQHAKGSIWLLVA